MELRDRVFIPIFTIALLISLFLLGASLTGYFAFIEQSMHCQDGNCYVLCNSNTDCQATKEVCCEENGIGICKEGVKCLEQYEFIPSLGPTSEESLRHTAQKSNTITFSATTFIIIVVGLLYIFSRKHHNKIHKKQEEF